MDPLEAPVPSDEPAPRRVPWASPVTLPGRLVRLEPLANGHLDGLVRAGRVPATWTWMRRPLTDRVSMAAWLDTALAGREAGTEEPFVTVEAATGRVIGSTRYLAIAPEHRRLEIGWTWLEPAAWGSGANLEAKYLLLEHAFEALGAMRVEFKTDAGNLRARAALAAIGGRFEGVFRRHMLMADGRVRDSAWYAVVDEDWPEAREALRARLARYGAPR